MKTKLTKLAAVASTLLVGASMLMPLAQAADTTVIGQTTSGGSLTIDSPASLELSGTTAAATTDVATGTVSAINPTDLRGTMAGWTVSVTTTHLGIDGTSADATLAQKTGSGIDVASALALTGTYDGMGAQASYAKDGSVNAGQFTVKIDTVDAGSPTMPATVTVTKPDGNTANPSVVANAITFNGLTLTFSGSVDYEANDEFTFNVDKYDYTGLTITPSQLSLTGIGNPVANTQNMTAGSSGLFSGTMATSASRTSFVAAAGFGVGGFNYDDGLSWVTHANPMAGSYHATLTYTAT